MKIVSQNSEADLRARAAQELIDAAQRRAECALRTLAANLIRVVRGAGRSSALVQEAHDFLEAVAGYYKAKPSGPYDPFTATTLHITRETLPSSLSASERQRARAQETLIRGALQIAASRLLGQTTQEAAGRSELDQGIHEVDVVRDKQRAAVHEAEARYRAGQPRRPKGKAAKKKVVKKAL